MDSYSNLINDINNRNIREIILIPNRREVEVIYLDGNTRIIPVLNNDQYLLRTIQANKIPLKVDYLKSEYASATLLYNLGIGIIFILLISYILKITSKTIKNTFNFLDKSNKIVPQDKISTTFDDVAGISDYIDDLKEIVAFLLETEKFEKLGAKAPKGLLLSGPPGTGKTLLARAIAGEANVPFFYISASEFIELFVGVGASRVKNLFEKAKLNSPCIIFIDEIDAIGTKRGSGIGIGNDEREQTLNQLLTEMDGFNSNTGILVLAATNRPHILDQALIRPGRFDRTIDLEIPDKTSRFEILKIHALCYPINKRVTLKNLAFKTAGFSGAQLKNLLNESAIVAATNNQKEIMNKDIEKAYDKLIFGQKVKRISYKQKLLLAYKQVSKPILAYYMSYPDRIDKISILTSQKIQTNKLFISGDDSLQNGFHTKTRLLEEIKLLLASRAVELIIFGRKEITDISSADLTSVWSLTKKFVEKFIFSRNSTVYIEYNNSNNIFTNRIRSRKSKYSEETKKNVDIEVRKIIDSCLKYDIKILEDKRNVLDSIAFKLIDKEIICAKDFYNTLEGINS